MAENSSVWRERGSIRAMRRSVDKADVQHLIGLVQHQIFGFGQVDRLTVQQVDQAARRGDQHVDATFQTGDLDVDRSTADDAEGADRGAFGKAGRVAIWVASSRVGARIRARRCAGSGLAAMGQQARQHRQREARLTGAGLGQTIQVFCRRQYEGWPA